MFEPYDVKTVILLYVLLLPYDWTYLIARLSILGRLTIPGAALTAYFHLYIPQNFISLTYKNPQIVRDLMSLTTCMLSSLIRHRLSPAISSWPDDRR